MTKPVKIRAIGHHEQEENVRDVLAGLIRNGADPLGMSIISDQITNKSYPGVFVSVVEDEDEKGTGGTFLITVQKISVATAGKTMVAWE